MKEQSLVIVGERERVRDRSLIVYFVLAYTISWAFMLPVALSAQGIIPQDVPYALYYLASFGPALSALIVTLTTKGRAGLGNLLERLWKWRVALRYYAFAVLGPIGLFALAVFANRIIAGAWPDLSQLGRADYIPYLGHPRRAAPVVSDLRSG